MIPLSIRNLYQQLSARHYPPSRYCGGGRDGQSVNILIPTSNGGFDLAFTRYNQLNRLDGLFRLDKQQEI